MTSSSQDPFDTAGLYVENNSSFDLEILVIANWNGEYRTGRTLPSGFKYEFRFPWGDFRASATADNGCRASRSGRVGEGRRDAWYLNDDGLECL